MTVTTKQNESETTNGEKRVRQTETPHYRGYFTLPLHPEELEKAGIPTDADGLPKLTEEKERLAEATAFFADFNRSGCCGKCVPCREGTRHIVELLEKLKEGRGGPADVQSLLELADTIYATSLCVLGKRAASQIAGIFQGVPDVFEEQSAGGAAEKQVLIYIDPALCRGCSKCSRICPVGAISGKIKEPFSIDSSKCIHCGACIATCPFKAVKEGE